jgi:hypothetical protein
MRMQRLSILGLLLGVALSATSAVAEDEPVQGDKLVSGMSILGNDEAPKALVIVPWKSSAMGDVLNVSRILDDGRQPVDREVFMRELDYYEMRAGHDGK